MAVLNPELLCHSDEHSERNVDSNRWKLPLDDSDSTAIDRLICLLGDHPRALRTGIYIGWTGYSNLGDEAMLEVCQSRLAQYRWVPFDLWNAQPRPTHFARNVWRSPATLLRSLRDELRTRRRLRALVRAREAGLNLGG